MIGISIRLSRTDLALRHLEFFTRTTRELCAQVASRNGPLVTMLPGSVQFFPCRWTVPLCTGRNEVCDSCWMNHGCGEVRRTCSLHRPSALTPTLARRAPQFALQLLYASAPLIP